MTLSPAILFYADPLQVPGTSYLYDTGDNIGGHAAVGTKHDGNGPLILVPQPSDSPEDPLVDFTFPLE